MPEAIEVEIYKKIAERAAGQKVAGVEILDDNYFVEKVQKSTLDLKLLISRFCKFDGMASSSCWILINQLWVYVLV